LSLWSPVCHAEVGGGYARQNAKPDSVVQRKVCTSGSAIDRLRRRCDIAFARIFLSAAHRFGPDIDARLHIMAMLGDLRELAVLCQQCLTRSMYLARELIKCCGRMIISNQQDRLMIY